MSRILDVSTSYVSTLLRPGAGTFVRGVGARPEARIRLYEFEGCPFCRKVREALTQLDHFERELKITVATCRTQRVDEADPVLPHHAGVPGMPDKKVSVREVFGIDTDLEVPAYSKPNDYVPDFDADYVFAKEVTLAILAGFKHNRRVMVQGYHGTGKSSHIEQVAARLNWPCIRINLDAHISRIDQPMRDSDGRTNFRFTRVETHGYPQMGWTLGVIDTDLPTLFRFETHAWPAKNP